MVESNLTGSGFQALAAAHALGCDVLFLTRSPQLYLSRPGVAPLFERYVGEVVTVDTDDINALEEKLRPMMPGLRGVVTFGEYAVISTAAVARRLGLPGPDPDAVRRARNKDEFRSICRRSGLPTPRYAVLSELDAVAAAVAAVGLPCVVKPVDESASVGVRACFDLAEVTDTVAGLLAAPANSRGQARTSRVLIEECLVGPEVSVEIIAAGTEVVVLGVTDKVLAGMPAFVEVGHTFPSGLALELVEACGAAAVNAVRAVGLTDCVAHVELKVTADGPRLIELNARPAGDRICDLVRLATGIDVITAALRIGVGLAVDCSARKSGAAAIRFLTPVPGRVRRIRGLEIACTVPGVVDVVVSVTEGSEIGQLRNSHRRAGHVVAEADTAYAASHAAQTASALILVETDVEARSGDLMLEGPEQ